MPYFQVPTKKGMGDQIATTDFRDELDDVDAFIEQSSGVVDISDIVEKSAASVSADLTLLQ